MFWAKSSSRSRSSIFSRAKSIAASMAFAFSFASASCHSQSWSILERSDRSFGSSAGKTSAGPTGTPSGRAAKIPSVRQRAAPERKSSIRLRTASAMPIDVSSKILPLGASRKAPALTQRAASGISAVTTILPSRRARRSSHPPHPAPAAQARARSSDGAAPAAGGWRPEKFSARAARRPCSIRPSPDRRRRRSGLPGPCARQQGTRRHRPTVSTGCYFAHVPTFEPIQEVVEMDEVICDSLEGA